MNELCKAINAACTAGKLGEPFPPIPKNLMYADWLLEHRYLLARKDAGLECRYDEVFKPKAEE